MLVVYLVMLLLLFLKSRISINFHVSGLKRVFLTIIGIPLTVISIATTLQIAVLGVQAFDITALQVLVSSWPLDGTYKQFIVNTPIVICLHAFITIFILSTINWIPKINLRRKASLPDISLEDDAEQHI
ncbi:hypothetical protein KA478_02775 [Patescibacteria group bacterium]|nr:hypothetical protein [Patescibacteria group bacterium]